MIPFDDSDFDDDAEPCDEPAIDDLDFDLEEAPEPDERDFWIEPDEEW